MLQSERLRIGDIHICEDLGVAHFDDNIRTLTESIDSNLAGVLNLLFR